jgi:BNR repeat-like domain
MKRTVLILLAAGLIFSVLEAQAQWTPAKRLTWTSGESYNPAIAVDSSGHLHMVWYDYTAGNGEIYYKRSEDGGESWSTSKRLTWTSGDSHYPAIAIDSLGHLHVVWEDYTPGNDEIYYKKSEDGGNSWAASKRLTMNSGYSQYASVAVDSLGRLHVVWQDSTPGYYKIYYKKSTDGGDSWAPSQRITWTTLNSYYPAIAVDPSNNLHLVWHDETPGNDEIYYKKSTNGGDSWAASQRLTWNSGGSHYPEMAVDASGHLHVVWHDETPGTQEIYYKKSEDGGGSWTTSRRLTWNSTVCLYPAIAADASGHLHVVWYDFAAGHAEIYYRESADGGDSWTASQRLTWNSGQSYSPAIAVDSLNHLHVVWNDDTPGNREIYYKKRN